MAREEQTEKSKKELQDRVWELSEDIRLCMFVTWDGKKQAARPLDATVDRDEHAIYFLTDKSGKKVGQISKFPVATVTFADPKSYKFVTMNGSAEVTNDRAKIKEIWTATSKAWWESAGHPSGDLHAAERRAVGQPEPAGVDGADADRRRDRRETEGRRPRQGGDLSGQNRRSLGHRLQRGKTFRRRALVERGGDLDEGVGIKTVEARAQRQRVGADVADLDPVAGVDGFG